MCKISKFFKRGAVKEAETEPERIPIKEGEVEPKRNLVKEKPRAFRRSRGGRDMPRYQPCPQCGKGSKRQVKTLTGAKYRCINHGEFLVVRR